MQNRPLLTFAALAAALLGLAWHRPGAPAGQTVASAFRGLIPLGRERLPAQPIPEFPSRNPANARLVINERGLDIIRHSESLRLNAYYLAGQWLIGYGHAATARKGMEISPIEAEILLAEDVMEAEAAVRRLTTAPLNENEFSALVSLAYNMGPTAFSRTKVLKRLNAGDRAGAARAFDSLVTAKVRGRRVVLDALRRRRAAERDLFLSRPIRG